MKLSPITSGTNTLCSVLEILAWVSLVFENQAVCSIIYRPLKSQQGEKVATSTVCGKVKGHLSPGVWGPNTERNPADTLDVTETRTDTAQGLWQYYSGFS